MEQPVNADRQLAGGKDAVPQAKVDAFVAHAREIVAGRYATLDTPDYTSVIDDRAFQRITRALEEAQSRGATLIQLIGGKKWDAATHKIAPHIVLNAPPDCELRTREIFGPVLPVVAYTSIDEVVHSINSGPRPLAGRQPRGPGPPRVPSG